jgi:DNA-binding NarL/FixJ family response regulator
LEPTDGLRIVLAEGQSLFRDAVRSALEAHTDIHVVAEAGDGMTAVAEAERTAPQLVLLDVNLPNRDGIGATRLVKDRIPGCKVLVLAHGEDDLTLLRAVEAGADGFVSKTGPLAELIDAVRAVHRGETVIPRRMLGPLLSRLLHRGREQEEALRLVSQLTRREREVLDLLACGSNNDRIAQALVISPQTARTHVQNLLAKLGVHSRLEAAAFVVRSGIQDELGGQGGVGRVARNGQRAGSREMSPWPG